MRMKYQHYNILFVQECRFTSNLGIVRQKNKNEFKGDIYHSYENKFTITK